MPQLEAELSKLKGELDAERAQAAAAAAEAGRREGELRAENDILLKNISCVFKARTPCCARASPFELAYLPVSHIAWSDREAFA